MKRFYKLSNLFLITILTLNLGLSPIWALERPTPPPKPEAPVEPTQIISPPPKPSKPAPPDNPLTPTPTPQPEEQVTTQDTDTDSESSSQSSTLSNSSTVENQQNGANSTNEATSENNQTTNVEQKNQAQIDNNINVVVDTGNNKANRNTTQTTAIETGDANIILGVGNNLNTNNVQNVQTASSPSQSSSPSNNSSVENSQNGANSTNQATSDQTQTTNVGQQNTVQISNQLTANANTGENKANYNTGGDVAIKTGDANVSTTVLNLANTNQATIKVKEFNILDDQTGDVTLDFTDAEVVDPNVVNSKNGAGSTNQATKTTEESSIVGQFNEADLGNTIVVNANTGDNKANYNTDGDVAIETGDANVVVNVINFLNNNLSAAGEMLVGVVNVVGNLVGDIILPQSKVANSENGAASTNEASLTQTQTTTLKQANLADIQNNFEVNADTGENKTNYGTAGNASTQTGNLNVNLESATVANQNIAGEEPIYVVLVNQLGQWTGQILGFGTSVINEGNGAGSTSQVSLTQESTHTTTQVNSTKINNNIVINANTGGNEANYTTGGDVNLETGNVNVAANVVNFLNNNFSGRKIIITIVNVLGSWVGNLVGEPAADTQDSHQQEELTTESTPEENQQQSEKLTVEPTTEQSSQSEEQATELVTEKPVESAVNTTLESSPSPQPSQSMPTPTPSLPSQPSFLSEEPVNFEVGDLLALLNAAELKAPEVLDSAEDQAQEPSSLPESSTSSLSSWSNQFKPSLGLDIEVGKNAPKLPWEISSGGLMILGLIFNLMRKRFFA